MAILFVAELYRFARNFWLSCSMFVLVPVMFNINFIFPLCACAAGVHILFLCSCFSCFIFCHFHLFIDPSMAPFEMFFFSSETGVEL